MYLGTGRRGNMLSLNRTNKGPFLILLLESPVGEYCVGLLGCEAHLRFIFSIIDSLVAIAGEVYIGRRSLS